VDCAHCSLTERNPNRWPAAVFLTEELMHTGLADYSTLSCLLHALPEPLFLALGPGVYRAMADRGVISYDYTPSPNAPQPPNPV
jgi:hypothetical protein